MLVVCQHTHKHTNTLRAPPRERDGTHGGDVDVLVGVVWLVDLHDCVHDPPSPSPAPTARSRAALLLGEGVDVLQGAGSHWAARLVVVKEILCRGLPEVHLCLSLEGSWGVRTVDPHR